MTTRYRVRQPTAHFSGWPDAAEYAAPESYPGIDPRTCIAPGTTERQLHNQ